MVTNLFLGDCSEQRRIKNSMCRFTHHWVSDTEDLFDSESLGLVHAVKLVLVHASYWFTLNRKYKVYALCCIVSMIMVAFSFKICKRKRKKEKQN